MHIVDRSDGLLAAEEIRLRFIGEVFWGSRMPVVDAATV
jgi:hypothetical protein